MIFNSDSPRYVVRATQLAMLMFAAIGLAGCQEKYEWRQKMTVAVEVDGKIYSGSSVVGIRWRKNDRLGAVNGPEWLSSVRGEATVVEIPGFGVLVALLNPPGFHHYTSDLALKVFEDQLDHATFGERLANLENDVGAKRTLSRKLHPYFVLFQDPSDPKSIRNAENIADKLREVNGKLKFVSLEITDMEATDGKIKMVFDWMSWSREEFLKYGDGITPLRIPNDSPVGYDAIDRYSLKAGK